MHSCRFLRSSLILACCGGGGEQNGGKGERKEGKQERVTIRTSSIENNYAPWSCLQNVNIKKIDPDLQSVAGDLSLVSLA